MTTASEMPVGSVVAQGDIRAWIKVGVQPGVTKGYEWRCTEGGHYHSLQIDDALFEGAVTLRLGV